MKKLMIAAATAAMVGGAFAASSACDDAEVRIDANGICDDATISATETEACRVWDFAVTLKTLAPKKLVCKSCKYDCGDDTIVSYLDNTTRKFTGYAWTCSEQCAEGYDDELNVTLWEKSSKSPVVPLFYNWVNQATGLARQDPEHFTSIVFVRYGKSATKVATYWSLVGAEESNFSCPFELTGAGVNGSGTKDELEDCGQINEGYGLLLKSISGYTVGYFGISEIWKKICGGTITYPIMKIGMCDCWESWCDGLDEYADGDEVPAAGTWSLKYNKSLSTKNKSMLTIVPSYDLVER